MHVHSTASELSKLGVQRSLGLPECATAPEEVYELGKRRGMDFVTITDHDTIDGALAISHLSEVFVSEELTVSFKGERQAVHVLCYGIDGADHEWLQAHNDDVEECAASLAASLLAIVWTPLLAERLRKTALAAVRDRSWESSLAQLAAGYRSALLRSGGSGRGVRVA